MGGKEIAVGNLGTCHHDLGNGGVHISGSEARFARGTKNGQSSEVLHIGLFSSGVGGGEGSGIGIDDPEGTVLWKLEVGWVFLEVLEVFRVQAELIQNQVVLGVLGEIAGGNGVLFSSIDLEQVVVYRRVDGQEGNVDWLLALVAAEEEVEDEIVSVVLFGRITLDVERTLNQQVLSVDDLQHSRIVILAFLTAHCSICHVSVVLAVLNGEVVLRLAQDLWIDCELV